jgi:hypothetical protein
MLIPENCKLEKLASKDKTRPAMHHFYLRITGEGDARQGFLEGTDSYKLARIPVTVDTEDTEGFVSRDAIGLARKLKCDRIVCNGSLELRSGDRTEATLVRESYGQFPDTDKLLELEPAKIDGCRFVIGLSPQLLHELADSMGADGVSLEFTANAGGQYSGTSLPAGAPSPLRPITVRPLTHSQQNYGRRRARVTHPNAVGLLMPIRVADTDV